ncbi:uncharacterized protein LOC111682718 [Lucilia cuprina]|uniref:uncharacterized protein LOC111682718 n=1 Tax=Lucilia cuprina TaxID=7375 RepID=UPI001F059468|nr:uncharacterized protein LOC111682718 [Lucilia cuprina]
MSDKQFTKRKWLFWTRDMIEKFIELLKEHECLYNNKNKFYYNRHIKDEICEYILHEMQKDKPAIQIGDIRRKMKVLRTQYARENRMLSLARVHGKVYEPKLWCYHKLSFLEKHTTCVTSINNKEAPTSHDETNTFSDEETFNYDDNEDNSLLMEIYKKEDVLNVDDTQYEEASKTNETIYEENKTTPKTENVEINDNDNNSNKKTSGKYDWVGDLVVSQMEDIDEAQRGDFVWDIQCVVRKYLMKSKVTREQASKSSKSNESEETATTTKDVTFHKGSNISVNVNFL